MEVTLHDFDAAHKRDDVIDEWSIEVRDTPGSHPRVLEMINHKKSPQSRFVI